MVMQKQSVWLWVLVLGLSACGGGGNGGGADDGSDADGSDGGAESHTYTGTVTAPSIDLAGLRRPSWFERAGDFVLPRAAADVSGLQAVGQATVELVDLSSGTVLGSAVTDGAGHFELEATEAPASTRVLRVAGTQLMRAPASASAMDINPVTEGVVRTMESAVASGEHDYSDYAAESLTAALSFLDGQDVDLSEAATIDEAIADFRERVTDFEDLIEDTTQAAPAGFGGEYGAIGIGTSLFALTNRPDRGDFAAVSLGIQDLSLRFGDTLDVAAESSEIELGLSPATGGIWVETEAWNDAGTESLGYQLSGSRFYIEGDSGLISSDGGLIAAALASAEAGTLSDGSEATIHDRSLLLGFRVPDDGAPALTGDYHLLGIASGFYTQLGRTGENDYLEGMLLSDVGEISVSGSAATISLQETETDVPLSSAGSASVGGEGLSFPATISADATGRVVLDLGGDTIDGMAAADGSLMAFRELADDGDAYSAQLILAVRKGDACSADRLSGTYRAVGYGPAFDGGEQQLNVSSDRGTLEIEDGVANYEFSIRDLDLGLSTSSEGEATTFHTGARSDSSGGSLSLDIAADCGLSAEADGLHLAGAASADGDVLVLLVSEDGPDSGSRELIVAFRR